MFRYSESSMAIVDNLCNIAEIAIAEIDSNLQISSCNDEFLKYVQLPRGEVVGSACREVFKCNGMRHSCPVLQTLSTGNPRNMVDKHPCNGSPSPSQFILYPIRKSNSSSSSVLFVMVSFSKIIQNLKSKALNLQYHDAGKRLRQLETAISDTLTVISHELKTPLTVSLGCIYLAMEEKDTRKRKEILRMARRNLMRQSRVIEQMLELSKIRCGFATLSLTKENISTIVQKAVMEKLPFARERGVKIEMKLQDMPEVEVDSAYLTYAIKEIIDNSIKFNRRGGRVKVSSYVEDGNVLIAVEDTGIGISEENLDRIFEPFYQEDSSSTRKYSGLGLGLTLAKRIVELHNGSIAVKSGQGEGSYFKIIIPAFRR